MRFLVALIALSLAVPDLAEARSRKRRDSGDSSSESSEGKSEGKKKRKKRRSSSDEDTEQKGDKDDQKADAAPAPLHIEFAPLTDDSDLDAAERKAVQDALAGAFGRTVPEGATPDAVAKAALRLDGNVRVLSIALAKKADGASVAELQRPLPATLAGLAAARLAGELLAKAENKTVQTLELTSEPPGVSVSLDGAAFGTTPIPRTFVSAGEHKVRYEKTDFVAAERSITVGAGEAKDDQATLELEPAIAAKRAEERAKAEAEERAREEARQKAAEATRKAAEEERARIEAFEAQAKAAAEAKRKEEQALREAAEARRDLFGLLVRLGGIAPSQDSVAGLQYLYDPDGSNGKSAPRLVLGASLRAPIWRNHWISADVDYWRDEFWVQAPPSGTPYELRVVPVGMVTSNLSAGRRERFGGMFFVDGGLSVGARLTRYAKHQKFQGGDPLDELVKRWSPAAGVSLAAGITLKHLELSLGWKLNFPLVSEPAADSIGPAPSIGGLGVVNLFGLQVGAVY